MHGPFFASVCIRICQYVNMGVRKWPKKSEEKQKYKSHKTLNPLGRKAFWGASFLATKHKKKDTLEACLSFWFPTAFRRPPLIGVFALSAICGRLAIGPQRWYHFNEVKTRAQGVTFFVISCISIASRAKEARRF